MSLLAKALGNQIFFMKVFEFGIHRQINYLSLSEQLWLKCGTVKWNSKNYLSVNLELKKIPKVVSFKLDDCIKITFLGKCISEIAGTVQWMVGVKKMDRETRCSSGIIKWDGENSSAWYESWLFRHNAKLTKCEFSWFSVIVMFYRNFIVIIHRIYFSIF